MPAPSRYAYAPVWLVALGSLAITAAVWSHTASAEQARRESALRRRIEHVRAEVTYRLSALHRLLAGAQGLFAASESVKRAEWREFVDRVDLAESCPEVYNFAWVAWVPRAEREAFLAATRADGAPDFRIDPPGPADVSMVITYAEPRAQNASVLGYDISTRPPAAEALLRARDTGEIAMSGAIRLLQEPAKQMSVILHMPVYRNAAPRATVEERRAAFQGTVSMGVRVGDLMAAALRGLDPSWRVRVYDGRLLAKDREIFAQESTAGPDEAMPRTSATVEFAGQTWTAELAIPARVLDAEGPPRAALILGLGAALSALLTLLVWSLATRQARAVDLAARMTRDLQLSTERIRGILDTASDGIITMTEDGVIESANAAAARIFGYLPSEVIGRSVTMLMPERWRTLHEDGLKRHIATGEGHFLGRTVEVEGLRKDGTVITIEVAISALRLGDRRLFTGIVRDVTQRRAHETQLKEANRKLAEAMSRLEVAQQDVVQKERLRALGTMASGIAHDFNNSLAAILGFTELLLLRDDLRADPEAIRKNLLLIRTAAMDASGVVGRLREFYRHRDETEAMESLDLSRLVTDAIALTRPRWKDQSQAKGIDIDVRPRLATDLPRVRGNATEIRETLVNLIINAIEAMPQGGWLTLSTRADEKRVYVEIEDTGVGMTEAVLRRCMEPFFTTKGAQSSGLGLSVAYGVLQRHGGLLEVESAPGEGTRVRLTFPSSEKEPAPAPEAVTTPTAPAHLNILVVDDDPLVREVVSGYLTTAGHAVETASDGQEGLQKFLAGRFDLVIADQGMPALTGVQLAAVVKRSAPNKPIILLTGWGDQMKAAGERPAEVDRILSKPVTLQDLLDAVGQLASRSK